MIDTISANTTSASDVLPLPSRIQKHLLICFPYAGGGISCFYDWRRLEGMCHVIAARLPGRDNLFHMAPYSRIEHLVSDLLRTFKGGFRGEYSLFGHSMGASIALALTCALREAGLEMPARIILSARRPPHLAERHPPRHLLSDIELLKLISELGGTPESILQDQDMRDLLIPRLRSDFRLIETHCFIPQQPLDVPIHIFGGRLDEHAPIEELREWQSYTNKKLSLHVFEGGHFFIHSQADAVLSKIEDILTGDASGA